MTPRLPRVATTVGHSSTKATSDGLGKAYMPPIGKTFEELKASAVGKAFVQLGFLIGTARGESQADTFTKT